MILFLWFVPFIVFASGSEAEEIPWETLFFQFINFSLFAALLVFLVRRYLPPFLIQQKEDFLEYKGRAIALEQQYKDACLKLEREIEELNEKQKNLKQDVEQAIKRLAQEMEEKEQDYQTNQQRQNREELKRQKLKATNQLKEKMLRTVMSQTTDKLKKALDSQKQDSLNWSFIKGLEKIK